MPAIWKTHDRCTQAAPTGPDWCPRTQEPASSESKTVGTSSAPVGGTDLESYPVSLLTLLTSIEASMYFEYSHGRSFVE